MLYFNSFYVLCFDNLRTFNIKLETFHTLKAWKLTASFYMWISEVQNSRIIQFLPMYLTNNQVNRWTLGAVLNFIMFNKYTYPKLISRWKQTTFEPPHEISNNVVCATSKASDQPVSPRSLIRALTSRLNILWILSYWPKIVWSF